MKKLTLYASLRSPFARRIRIALKRLNWPHEVTFMNVFEKNDQLLKANPLALVPTLIVGEGAGASVVTDSATILEFLHDHTGKIWPADLEARTAIRQASTWCEGVMQYSVNYYLETKEHEVPSPSWVAEYEENARNTLQALAQLPEKTWKQSGELTQAAWDLCTALQYAELRLPQLEVFAKYTPFKSIYAECCQYSEFLETIPPAQ